MGKEDEAGLLAPPAAVVDSPAFFSSAPRVRRDGAWALAFGAVYILSLVLGGIAASAVNPAYEVLSSTSALAVRPSNFESLGLWRPRTPRQHAALTPVACAGLRDVSRGRVVVAASPGGDGHARG